MSEPSTCRAADGRQISWAEWGDPDGLPVLFLHGTPGGRLGPMAQSDSFARQGLRIIAPDRPGYGSTDPLPGRSILSAAADLVAVLDHLSLARVLVAGGSGGGPHALGLAAAAPERVTAVGVLVGAAPLEAAEIEAQVAFNSEVLALAEQPQALREKLEGAREVVLTQGVAGLLPDASAADKELWRQRAEAMQAMVGSALGPGVDGWVDDYVAIWGSPWGFEPDDVRHRVLWGHGSADVNVPIAAAERLAARLPDCRFLTWPGMGHAPGLEQTAEFFCALLSRASGL